MPASEDFVNSATVFVNSATPRGRVPRSPVYSFSFCSFSLAQRKELKETFPQPRPSPEGRMQPLLLVALSLRYARGIKAPAWIVLMGRCPIKKSLRMECAEGVCQGVPGRPAENKTAELITMKDELGGEYVFNDSFAEYAKVSSGLLLKRFCSVPRTRSTDRP